MWLWLHLGIKSIPEVDTKIQGSINLNLVFGLQLWYIIELLKLIGKDCDKSGSRAKWLNTSLNLLAIPSPSVRTVSVALHPQKEIRHKAKLAQHLFST